MDPKLKALVGHTNIETLIQGKVEEVDLHQPVQSGSVPVIEPMRSTADPLQIHFATGDMVGKLREPSSNNRMRTIAVVFIGLPMMLMALILLVSAWTSPTVTPARALLTSGIALAMFAFWPWLIFSGRRKRAASSS